DIVAVDAATGAETAAVRSVPDASGLEFTPDGRYLIMSLVQKGRQEDPAVYQVLEPEDRQPGWRDRNGIAIYDLAAGVAAPVTFGNRNVVLHDISPDSRHLLLSVAESRLSKRPTTLFSLYSLNLDTMQADTLVSKDGFIGSATYSPDGRQVLLSGSPEALDGIGKNLPADRIPSMTDQQLYIIDLATGEARPMTRDFNPSVGSFRWSRADGRIYFTAEDRDESGLFRLDPKTGKIARISLPEEMVTGFSVPDAGGVMAWYGESASSPSSLYLLDTAKMLSTRLETPKEEMLADVELGRCEAWDFVNSRGDTICGRFYLPPDFDPSVKYPMIVNYYGGCSPIERTFESRYPHHAYAAQGYVVYVIEPSGATGFGQEFSSRHVNTAGKGVADDIIEGTKEFCRQHPWVDEKKIGCIGASYGGFMTQYLQTVTDIFAAAISHAGISDHTSYWGEGYWGYSYSEVSMAGSYPWSDPDLYVRQSPLFNADRIHTPLLFLHGDKDNNVPVGESIQMFTALKLLDRPTAFVAVADQDHHILDYDKRHKWQDTIFAWFARYLKDDPSWWEAMYPVTPL
ncbi:MAG: prolyl oligopeptidase family serine peptidase, partial [Muribaculaceae bacterium]|nr:prolyl oligopeptidase family serine peptidase [Muribaculaceae bacterium]